MKKYNKIMQIIWLVIGVVIFLAVTYKCLQDGFERWSMAYVFALLAFFIYFIRRYMMKRMERHQEYLDKNNHPRK